MKGTLVERAVSHQLSFYDSRSVDEISLYLRTPDVSFAGRITELQLRSFCSVCFDRGCYLVEKLGMDDVSMDQLESVRHMHKRLRTLIAVEAE